MQKHMDRLPKTKEFLHCNIESLEDFQLRRIKWAMKELAKDGEVKAWDVILKAGLSKNFYSKLHTYINKIIDEQNIEMSVKET